MPYQRKTTIPHGQRIAVSAQIAAELCGVKPKVIYAAVQSGALPAKGFAA